jgi:diacylglycerol O-acyltransferase / wax synthase
VWVDDPHFNLVYHVRHTALPRPGEERQLKRLCGRILSQKLDLTKPLWEIWVIEGMAEGRFALVAKAHHCMVDGISGMDLLTVLLSPTPDIGFEPGPRWTPRPAPRPLALLAAEVQRRAAAPLGLLGTAGGWLRDPLGSLGAARDGVLGVLETLGVSGTPASETPLNPLHIGPHRRFDWLRMPLDEVKAVKARLGGTVNDVVLATVVGAVRSYLQGRDVDPDRLDFRAMVPVSMRRPDEQGRLGNRVSQLLAMLPIADGDRRRRFQRVVQTTRALKGSHQAAGGELIEEIGNWTATAVLSEFMRLGSRFRAYNVVVTNVPGPPVPLYLLGARLDAPYPMVPLFTNQAVGVALFSYAGGLYWGVSADWDHVPDLHDLVDALGAEFEALRGL